jgi:hypothetical protein
MRYFEFRETIMEGGNIFKDASGQIQTIRIDKNDINPTIQWLENITGLPLVDNTLGSVGKKATSGDLDIAVDQKAISKDQLYSRLLGWLQKQGIPDNEIINTSKYKGGWLDKTGISVHLKTPIQGNPQKGFVQTDFMFGDDIEQMKFGLHSAGDASKYSGADRNLLMSSIAKSLGDLKYSWQKGLMNRNTDQVLSTNPDVIANTLLGPGATGKDFESVETIMAFLSKNPKKIEWLKKLIMKLRDPTDKKPGLIKSDSEEASRIENALRALQK